MEELKEILSKLQAIGATRNIFVVGGDPSKAEGPFADSLSLIQTGILPEYGVREVGVAGYPEGHPDIADQKLWEALTNKLDALEGQGLESSIISQFTFSVGAVQAWVEEVRRRGIEAKIRIGSPGPAGVKRLLGFARRLGIATNASMIKKYGFSVTNLIGSSTPDKFIQEAARELNDPNTGDIAIHFYTFGGVKDCVEWIHKFRGRP